jgi:hypothetical protein
LSSFIIVSQVKSNRVVYFTDDATYQPPTDGDWYYCSTFSGDLPKGMTLKNCWGWRFNGTAFTDARAKVAKTTAELLIENNKKALQKLLKEKIDAARAPYRPTHVGGDVVRQQKLAEANAFLAGAENGGKVSGAESYPLLSGVAEARNVSLHEAARLVRSKAEEAQAMLVESERVRERLSTAIRNGKTEAELRGIREELLEKAYPELSTKFKYVVSNTTPIKLDAPLTTTHRAHEVARLKAQLKASINRKRNALRGDFVGDEVVLQERRKAARKADGANTGVLEAYAAARKIDLVEAAKRVLDEAKAEAELLATTERVKEDMLARIEAVRTLADVNGVAKVLGGI